MKTKGIFIVTYFSFKDPLIQAYTLPYVKIIRKIIDKDYPIYILTIEKINQKLTVEEKKKIEESLGRENIKLISLNYHRFGIGLLNWIPSLIQILFKNISTIHAWCTPGGAIGLILSTLTGKRLVIDSFEPHAEVMAETETWRYQSLQYKVLFKFEEWMAKRSHAQICCTESMKTYVQQKFNITLSNPSTKPACVDLNNFSWNNKKKPELLKELGLNDKTVCVYAGKFGGLYLESEVFKFLKVAYEEIGEQFRVLLLTNDSNERICQWSKDARIPSHIIVKRFVTHDLVSDYIGLGDFALAPYRPVASRNYGAPIKISEYWALGLPVIITSNIADDSYIIEKNKIGSVLKKLEIENYRRSIKEIMSMINKNSNRELYDKIRPFAEKLRNFELAEEVYKKLYL
jgi:hypothetical protein